MFPSSGYFRGVNCPYFASGLCDRVYCHFRHSKPPEEKPKDDLPSYSTKTGPSYSFNSSQISGYSASPYLSKTIAGFMESPNQSSSQESYTINKETYTTENENNYTCPIPSFSEATSVLPESTREPDIDRQSLPKISGLAKRKSNPPPSYNPTPKNIGSKSQSKSNDDYAIPSYHPTPKNLSSVNEESRPGKKSIIQYDPVKNYAVNPKECSSSDDELEAKKSNISHEAEFSAEEDETEGDMTEKNDHAHVENGSESHSEISVPNYAKLLTPSSYFTNKLSSLLCNSKSDDDSGHGCQLLVESDSSSSASRQNGNVNKKADFHSTLTDKRSGSKSRHHSSSSKSSSSGSKGKSHRDSSSSSRLQKESKSHASSSSSCPSKSSSKPSSSSSGSTSSKSTSSSNLHNSEQKSKHSSRHSSSESKRKVELMDSKSDSYNVHSKTKTADSHSTSKKDKSSSECNPKISHSNSKNSQSSCSISKHSGADGAKHSSSRSNSGSKSSSKHSGGSSSKHSSAKEACIPEKENNHKKHISKTSPSMSLSPSSSSSSLPSSRSSKDLKRSDSEILRKKDCDSKTFSRSLSCSSKANKSHNNDIIKLKEERSSLDTKKVQFHSHNHSEKIKRKDSTYKGMTNEKEKLKSDIISHTSKNEGIKIEGKMEKLKNKRQRHFSDITSDLFGEESDGSDSDVQIIEPPPEPPPVVLELSDSDEEYSGIGLLKEEDFNFSDSDTFDECLRIFKETDRKLSKKRAASPDTQREHEPSKKNDHEDHGIPGKKRMAHASAQQVVRPSKAPVSSKHRLTPAEVMHNRIVEMQKRALLRAAKREGREADLPRNFENSSATTNPSVVINRSSPVRSSSSSSTSNKQLPSSMVGSAALLLSSQKKREAHLPMTPTKAMSKSADPKDAVWSPKSFYKKKMQAVEANQRISGKSENDNWVTIAGTASKTEKRKAHIPTNLNLKRPLIAAGDSSKVPINVRQRYLNLIIDEFLKFCQEETAFQKGQEEEQKVYEKVTNKNIYLRVAVNAIKRIRTEASLSQPSSSKKAKLDLSAMASLGSSSVSQSHEATLGGSRAAKTSFTLNRSGGHRAPTNFKGLELYNRLKKHIMTEEQLRENNYPRPSEDGSNKAKYYSSKAQNTLMKDNERNCRRCGKTYYVKEDGSPVNPQQCIYHYSNMYKKKVAGSIDSRYGCCNERAEAKGCQVANSHVSERNKFENLSGYMKTLPAAESDPKNTKVLSLDCEMVYTKAGMELARITVIGDECQVLYETLVKPDTDIIDYNTRFSGITAKDMKGVETSLRGVQAILLSMISDKTILIGHSLESDLTALKLIHNTVVDTSIVFPHRRGLPYKRALRNLMVDHLQKIIQSDDGGHDSKEDAISCMQLMIYKVKQEAKSEVRRF